MEIKRLGSDVISKIRSSFNINSIAQCVFELVSNSLDSKSTSIAVRINLVTFKIQVADNGDGITKKNLQLLGIRYMTNKCHHLEDFEKHLSTYGFRGEAVASIAEMSKRVSISSRHKNSSETYSKVLTRDLRSEVKLIKHRASIGTTVTVLGFLSNFPVRQQRVIREIELEEVKKYIERLVIINPGTSFSLRNDVTGLLMLNNPRSSDIIGSFRHLHPEITESFTLLKVSKNKITIVALIHKEFILSKKFQYVYVNKRPVFSHRIQKNVNKSFYKKMQLKIKRYVNPICETVRYPVYVLNIRCPQSYVDVFIEPSKCEVEFKCWDLVLACIEKIIKTFFGLDDEKNNKPQLERKDVVEFGCGVSQVVGAVQACAFKRKNEEVTSDKQDNFANDNSEHVIQNTGRREAKKSKVTCLEDRKKSKVNKESKGKPLQKFTRDKTIITSSQNAKISGNYEIEDSGKEKEHYMKPRKLKSIIKKPLAIKTEPKIHNFKPKLDLIQTKSDRVKEFDLSSDCRMEEDPCPDQQLLSKHPFDQKSVYSNLNTDEDQGKNLIMDMFLKSTQVFTGADGKSDVNSVPCENVTSETIEESNFVLENNIQDTVRGINTTMSISVNVKKKRLRNCNDKASKCVQTSVVEERLNNLTSKCVQTSQKPSLTRVRSNLSDLTHKFDDFKLNNINEDAKDNYTILINTIRKKREFRFVRKSEEMETDGSEGEQNFRPIKICRCSSDDDMIFKFDRRDKSGILSLEDQKADFAASPTDAIKENVYKNHQNIPVIFKRPKTPTIINPDADVDKPIREKTKENILKFRGVRKQSAPKIPENINLCERSPYFTKKAIQTPKQLKLPDFVDNNLRRRTHFIPSPYENFQPVFKSTQFRQNSECDDILNTAPHNVESSPYFAKNVAKFDVIAQEDNMLLTKRECRIGKSYYPRQTNEYFPNHDLNLIHLNQNFNQFGPNCPKTHTILENNAELLRLEDYYKYPNANCELPCCHDNICPSNVFPGKNPHLMGPRNISNGFDRHNCCRQKCCHYNECIWPSNNIEAVTRDGPKESTVNRNTDHTYVPLLEQKGLCSKCNERKDKADSVTNFNPVNQKNLFLNEIKSNNLKSIKNHEESIDMDIEEPAWYTPNVSDENLYFKRRLSEPKEIENENKDVTFGGLLGVNQNIDEGNNVCEEGKKFDFKFTPDIFSSDAEKNLEVAQETVSRNVAVNNPENVLEIIKNNHVDSSLKIVRKNNQQSNGNEFNNFFDLASFGIINSKEGNKTTNTICPSKEGSNLEITLLSDGEKQNIIAKELFETGKNNKDRVFNSQSEVKIVEAKENEENIEKSRIIVDSQNEWLRKYNEDGKGFYFNKRTGMVSTVTPKTDQAAFFVDKRLDLVPIGRSPVMKEHKKIDRSLSQNAKSKLHHFIMESYENELMVIKWQNFIYDDPKSFFEEIYKEKTKQFETAVPSVQDNNHMKCKVPKDFMGFTSKLFETIKVIGQVDKKFIAVLEKTKMLVLLFDQHAVHERIRVEQLLKEYKGVKASCKRKLTFFMPRNDLALLKNHYAYLRSLGLDVEFFTDCLNVLTVPLCIQEKFNSPDNLEDINKIINILVTDIIERLKITRGSTSQLPKVIQNIINLKACRGAIKFGDSLTKEECEKLLKDLAKCNLPFQCAHGRPTLTPVLTLSKIEINKKVKKLNLKKLLRMI